MTLVSNEYVFTNLTSATNTAVQIATGRVILHFITVNSTSALTIGVINGTSGNVTSSNVARLKASVAEGTYRYDVTLGTGLRIAPSGHFGDVTVVWSQG